MSGVERVVQVDDLHNHWVMNIGGVRREFDTRITEQIPDERVAWTTEEGDLRQSGVVTFHRLDEDHTKVMVQFDIKPAGAIELAAEKLNVIAAQTKADMRRFKKFIEARGTETGAWRDEVDRPKP